MPRARTGFGRMKEQQARQDANFKGDYIPYLRLKDDGDMVKFRVVSGCEEAETEKEGFFHTLMSAEFHRVTKRGTKGNQYIGNEMCSLDEDEEGILTGECVYCEEDNRRSTQFLCWVYVSLIYHAKQSENPKVEWERGTLGAKRVFVEEANKYMVWQDGYFMIQMLESRIEMNGTLSDRDFRLTRHGARGSQQVRRELENLKESPIDPKIVAGSEELPSLYSIADGSVTKIDGTGDEASSGDSREYATTNLPSFDDDVDSSSPQTEERTVESFINNDLDDLPF